MNNFPNYSLKLTSCWILYNSLEILLPNRHQIRDPILVKITAVYSLNDEHTYSKYLMIKQYYLERHLNKDYSKKKLDLFTHTLEINRTICKAKIGKMKYFKLTHIRIQIYFGLNHILLKNQQLFMLFMFTSIVKYMLNGIMIANMQISMMFFRT